MSDNHTVSDPANKPDERGQRFNRRGRLLRVVSVAAIVGAGVSVLAACGSSPSGPGVASAGSTTTSAGSSSAGGSGSGTQAQGESRLLKYSQCMRAHGISDFPDPSSSGNLTIRVQPGSDLNPHAPQNQAAQNACKAPQPGGNPTPAQEATANANALKYSHCMQSNGIADFPDPNGKGTLTINLGTGDLGDLDPNSSRFHAAERACQSLDTGFNTNENDLSPPPVGGQGGTGGH
jgi:hypothetical protein